MKDRVIVDPREHFKLLANPEKWLERQERIKKLPWGVKILHYLSPLIPIAAIFGLCLVAFGSSWTFSFFKVTLLFTGLIIALGFLVVAIVFLIPERWLEKEET